MARNRSYRYDFETYENLSHKQSVSFYGPYLCNTARYDRFTSNFIIEKLKSLTDSPPIVDEHMASIVMERSRPPSQPTTPRTKNVTAFL